MGEHRDVKNVLEGIIEKYSIIRRKDVRYNENISGFITEEKMEVLMGFSRKVKTNIKPL